MNSFKNIPLAAAFMERTYDDLIEACQKYHPTLRKVIHHFLGGDSCYYGAEEHALRAPLICGAVARTVQHLFAAEGFPVKLAYGTQLGEEYPTADHTFCIVNVGEEIIVYGAYLQFLRGFNLPKSEENNNDLFIASYTDLKRKIQDLIINYKEKNRFLDVDDKELRHYLWRLWDYNSSSYRITDKNQLLPYVERHRAKDHQLMHPNVVRLINSLHACGVIDSLLI